MKEHKKIKNKMDKLKVKKNDTEKEKWKKKYQKKQMK